jgi:hypothetical protein
MAPPAAKAPPCLDLGREPAALAASLAKQFAKRAGDVSP